MFDHPEIILDILEDAGGTYAGHNRLEACVFFVETAGLGRGFPIRDFYRGGHADLPLHEAVSFLIAGGAVRNSYAERGDGETHIIYSLLPRPWSVCRDWFYTRNGERAKMADLIQTADTLNARLAAMALYHVMELGFPADTAGRLIDTWASGARENVGKLYGALREIAPELPALGFDGGHTKT